MGYITTIAFRNNGFSDMEKDPKGTIDKIRKAMNGVPTDDPNMISHAPVHSHDSAVYVSQGDTSVDATNPRIMKKIMREAPGAFANILASVGGCYTQINLWWQEVRKKGKKK